MKYLNLLLRIFSIAGIGALLFALYYSFTHKPADFKRTFSFPQLESSFNFSWAMDTMWDDGKAEVAQYDASRTVYDQPRQFIYTYITVKEEFNKQYKVKSDNEERADLYPVMKVNAFARIETKKYPYHYLSSSFFIRQDPLLLHKMSVSSQEWCGNTFKEIIRGENGQKMIYHSYWDKEGDGEKEMPQKVLFEDQLIYSLRSLHFKDGLSFKARVLESLISNKISGMRVYDAVFNVNEGGTIPSGDQQLPCWKVTVSLNKEKTNTYYFCKDYPNILVSQHTWDGRTLSLKKAYREAYWETE